MTTYDPPADSQTTFNPYRAPAARLEQPASSSDEAVRRELLKHEAGVRSIGVLYYLSAFALMTVGGVALVGTIADGGSAMAFGLAISLFALILGGAYLAVARGVRRLDRWVRVPIGIISGLSLLSFPLGTLLHGYILYLVFSARGNRVLSPEYQRIRLATPQIKPKTSPIVVFFVVLLLGLIGMGVLAVVLGG